MRDIVPALKYQFHTGAADIRLMVKDQPDVNIPKPWKKVDMKQLDPLNLLPPFNFITPEGPADNHPSARETINPVNSDDEDDA